MDKQSELNIIEAEVARRVREFESGATRDTDKDKLDYEGFLSPTVIDRFAEYMHENRVLPDGSYRDSDNWQKGIPLDQYMKSLYRHFQAAWREHRSSDYDQASMEEALCGVLFNAMGYLFEILQNG